jgi:hypothetical protein
MSATGDALGQKLHEAAIQGITMSDDERNRSLAAWKAISNALIDFLADMGTNPLTLTCGSSTLTVSSSGITIESNVTSIKNGSSEVIVDSSGVTASGLAIHLN